ncbi:MAG: NAD(P)/FAD-dependent oxidoreductase [Treponema sp.]|nr:NAD(P)/FAD-dependent oxidoreductase [Treponema sp.]
MYDVAIIGAGVTGTAIARELSRYDLKAILLEQENDVSMGTSKANSGIVHAGYDPEGHTLMAKFNAQGNQMFTAIAEELSVPFIRNGSMVVAFDDEQLSHIEVLRQRGLDNGIPGLSILSKDELIKKEPAINPEARGALFAETAGIVDPMLLTISLMESAVLNGLEYIFGFKVEGIKKEGESYLISSADKTVQAAYVINAAGVFSDKIHDLAAPQAFKINPRRGQYFLLDKVEGNVVNATLFPCPSKIGKGILVAPTAHGNIIMGPASDDVDDRNDVGTTEEILEEARRGARLLVPQLSTRNTIRTFSGIRAESDTGDFIVQEAEGAPHFFDVGGIKSPGLTAAPAIAVHVVSLLEEKGLALKKKQSFNPIIKRKLFIDLAEGDQVNLIKQNPLYGRVICRCEQITEGDIVDAIKRKPGAVSVDGVKRRCRAGMGRCQGGFCGPKVQQILARELGLPLEEIMLEKSGSYILTGRTK